VTDPSNGSDGGKGENIGVRRGMFGPKGSGDTSGYGRLVREVAMPGSSPRPYGGYFDEVVDTLTRVLGEHAYDAAVERVVVYPLMSITHNRRIQVEATAPDADPHIPSVFSVYPTCDWHERETYDFFGIIFDGHPALTRIEMPDDWVGHPQRKDYPLGGIPVEYHGAEIPPPDERRAYS
jgi:NADH-quinone oxidoreductase subunit C